MPNIGPPPPDDLRPGLALVDCPDGVWIVDAMHDAAYGPYATKREAELDLRGLDRFWYSWLRLKHLDEISPEQATAALAGWHQKVYNDSPTSDTPTPETPPLTE